MIMDNGIEKQQVRIDKSNIGLMIPPMVWHEMHDFSEDCVMLVLASDYYFEDDYIREYKEFKKHNSLELVDYDRGFLDKSWDWLNDKELKYLTMTPNFDKSEQVDFFNSLDTRENYFIYGITFMGVAIGACGLKNFINEKAELWLYIGDKSYWGKGLGKIIMNRLEEKALDKNLLKLYLKVIKENLVAINLYKNIGYTEIDNVNGYITMEKKL